MIKIRIKNADHEIDVRFPISENELYAKLAEIHAIEEKDAPQSAFVTEVYWPEEFSMLKDRFANLDELNYLAKRMESFDYHEYDQFLIGITKLQNPTEKDLINLTFNLDHFTLCKDVSSYGKIGREYVMNTQGAVPANDEDDPKYAAIGKELIDKGLAQITGKGLLIYNPFDELTEVYDGQTFPEYYYENTIKHAQPWSTLSKQRSRWVITILLISLISHSIMPDVCMRKEMIRFPKNTTISVSTFGIACPAVVPETYA